MNPGPGIDDTETMMKSLATLTICSSAIVLAGCASDIPPDRATFNEDMLNYHAAESVDAAIEKVTGKKVH